MKKFVTNILGFAIATVVLMYLLDFGYTAIYKKSSPFTKIQYLRSLKNKKVDYIFIGSSRVANGIVPSIVEEKTQKSTLNLGVHAAKLHDIYTLLQLVEYYDLKYEKVFIQVDYIYNFNSHSTLFEHETLPFIHENDIYRRQVKYNTPDYLYYYHVPFYRYARNDIKLGFREIVRNWIKDKPAIINSKGYLPLEGNTAHHNFELPPTINRENSNIDSIQHFCKKNKIDVVFYCAPFCPHTKNLDFIPKLQSKIPGLHDFSTAIKDDKLFQNASHMNDEGAKLFTTIFIDKLLKNEK